MYLSRVVISNYKSIDFIDISFKKGKNVIVGKNNAGKSNILKAIDLVLGEQSPTYAKSDNINENDFHMKNLKDPIYIYCELTRESDELLNYDVIKHAFAFPVYPEIFPIDHDVICDCFEKIKDLDFDKVKPDWYGKQKSFKAILDDKFHFAYLFYAEFDQNSGKINKGIRFLFRRHASQDWFITDRASIRNELLQSAIIPSFRDPSNQLKITNYSWFGKLMKHYYNQNSEAQEQLQEAFKHVEKISNDFFKNLHMEINSPTINIAFPDTQISVQFNPSNNADVYKNAMVYVDDGFESLLTSKGSGIQSVTIVGLFKHYTEKVSHVSSALLCVEEPELYLHPQAKRMLSNRLNEFLDNGKNQVVITTHSVEFINFAHESLNIIVLKKDRKTGTTSKSLPLGLKERKVLLNTQNAEMFFADAVILVEGGEKYIIEAIAKEMGKNDSMLSENWLDDNNISIIDVGGKGNFGQYRNILNQIGVDNYVIADFDFFTRGFAEFITACALLELKERHNNLNSKIPGIKRLSDIKKLTDIDDQNVQTQVNNFINDLHRHKLYILSGQLEDFFKEKLNNLFLQKPDHSVKFTKLDKPIYICTDLLDQHSINELINLEEYKAVLMDVVKSFILKDNSNIANHGLCENNSDYTQNYLLQNNIKEKYLAYYKLADISEIQIDEIKELGKNLDGNILIYVKILDSKWILVIDKNVHQVLNHTEVEYVREKVDELCYSGSYACVHKNIGELRKIMTYLSNENINQLIKSSIDNNQIYGIFSDDAVNNFFTKLYHAKCDILDQDLKDKFEDVFDIKIDIKQSAVNVENDTDDLSRVDDIPF